MPKPKRKRAVKSSSSDPVPESAPQSRDKTPAVGFATRLIGSEEREAFELPDIGALAANLRRDLDREPDPVRRLRLYDLALMELEAARDNGSRLYTLQANAGELVNPEDIEAYASRLLDMIAKLQLERERLRLEEDSSVPAVSITDARHPARPVIPLISSFAQGAPAKIYPEILTAAETAELLRLKLSRFYQVYRSLGIPYFTEHSQLRFRKVQVEAWIEESEKGAHNTPPSMRRKANQGKKSAGKRPQPSVPVAQSDDVSGLDCTAASFRDTDDFSSAFIAAVSALAGMLVMRRWIDPGSGPRFGEWLAKPKDFMGPPVNWIVGTRTLYTFVVCLCHANILVLEPGTKKKGPVAPQYAPAILKAFVVNGRKPSEGINRTIMKHEAAVKFFRDVITSHAVEQLGVLHRTDCFLENIDIYYKNQKKQEFSPVAQRLAQGLPIEDGKPPVGVFSILDENVLRMLMSLVDEYPELLDTEPSL